MSGDTERPCKIHDLKCWPLHFARTEQGVKRFEVRQNDRDFRTGDHVRLLEFDPNVGLTGREMVFGIGLVLDLTVAPIGIAESLVVFQLEDLKHGPRSVLQHEVFISGDLRCGKRDCEQWDYCSVSGGSHDLTFPRIMAGPEDRLDPFANGLCAAICLDYEPQDTDTDSE